MKWLLRVLIALGLTVIISLLVVLPHVLGNEVLTNEQIVRFTDVVKIPCDWNENPDEIGYFCK